MTKREELAAWLTEMPEADIETLWAVASRLRVTMAPTGTGLPDWLMNAPLDDEPLTDSDLAAIAEAEADYAAGRSIPSAEAKRRLLA
jgi:hypothetical protein